MILVISLVRWGTDGDLILVQTKPKPSLPESGRSVVDPRLCAIELKNLRRRGIDPIPNPFSFSTAPKSRLKVAFVFFVGSLNM